jgi:serine/threonine protein kinase
MENLQPGEVLEGRYRIDALLASGGQAHVYRGSHLGLGRDVAVKVLKNDFTEAVRHRMAKRFEREARLISQLRDPHTITLYDFGTLRDGSMFMVFEFIDGMSLRELVEAQGAIDGARVHKILRQTLSSLQEAHAFGVLHRDLKPQNIMVYEHAGRTDQVKLLDFGIAKIMSGDAEDLESLTNVNSVVGTPRYLAPEIFQEGTASAASDIYSLGLVAYELLVTKPAILGATPFDIVRNSTSPSPIRIPPGAPVNPELRALIERMLEKDASRRFATADDVLRVLDSCPAQTPAPQDLDDFPEIAIEPLDADDVPSAGAPSSAPFTSPSTSEYDRGVYHTPAQVNTLTDYTNPDNPGIVSADEFASMSGSTGIARDDAPTAMVSPESLAGAGLFHLDVDDQAEDYEPTELSDLSELDFGSVSNDDLDMLAGALAEDSVEDSQADDLEPDPGASPTQVLSPFDVSKIVSQDDYEPTELSDLSGLDLDEGPPSSLEARPAPRPTLAQLERVREGVAAARSAMRDQGLSTPEEDVADAKTERLEVLPPVYASSAVLRRPRRRKKSKRRTGDDRDDS